MCSVFLGGTALAVDLACCIKVFVVVGKELVHSLSCGKYIEGKMDPEGFKEWVVSAFEGWENFVWDLRPRVLGGKRFF